MLETMLSDSGTGRVIAKTGITGMAIPAMNRMLFPAELRKDFL